MEVYVQGLRGKMEAALKEVDQEASPIKRFYLSIKLTRAILEELKMWALTYTFASKAEEIRYFKHLAPPFYGRLFYFIKVYSMEVLKLSASKVSRRRAYERGLKEIDRFFSHNSDFCRYYYIGDTLMDESLFTHHTPEGWVLEDLSAVIDSHFSIASYRVAWILAYEQYRHYLEQELKGLEHPENDPGIFELLGHQYRWKPGKSAASEVIKAFYKVKAIEMDGEDADIKDIALIFETFFHMDLGNFYETMRRNQQRKKDSSPFLHSLIEALTEK